jgi:hypothetical protein
MRWCVNALEKRLNDRTDGAAFTVGYIQCFSDCERTSLVVDRQFAARACDCITGIGSPHLASVFSPEVLTCTGKSPRSRESETCGSSMPSPEAGCCRNPVVVDCPIIVSRT